MKKVISSPQNELVKNLVSLQQKRNIVASELCFLEGQKLVLEFLENKSAQVVQVFATKNKLNEWEKLQQQKNNFELYEISEQVAKKISGTVTHPGVFATAKLPKPQKFNQNKNFLVLDTVQDPTNLGAITRSALAFGFDQIILINSAYPFTPKVIRSSMGYVLKTNFHFLSTTELEQLVKEHNLNLICADMHGQEVSEFAKTNKLQSFGIVLGSEGQGVGKEVQMLCNYTVSVNMQNNVESLNVATTASIFMFALSQNG